MVSNKSKDIVFDFFENAKNLELGGIINNVVKDRDDWYTFNHVVAGNTRIKIAAKDRKLGVLDHLFVGGGLSWTVYVRIIDNGMVARRLGRFLNLMDSLTYNLMNN